MQQAIDSNIQEHLDSNEKLIWTGQAKQGIVFRNSDFFLIPFSILWCGFAFFWFTSVLSSGAPIFFALFGIPFIVIGLIFVFGRFIIDAKQRKKTYYGITDSRIIIISGIFKKSVKSLNIKTLSDIEFDEKKDGTGTINIGPKNPFMIWGNGMNWWPGIKPTPSLDLIQDVKKVYAIILEAQKKL